MPSAPTDPVFLVIDTRDGGDWSLDLMFAGLVRALGPGRVLDCPFKLKHREWSPSRLEEPRDWGLERRTLGYTPANVLIPGFDVPDGQMEAFVRFLAAQKQLVVLTDERDSSHEVYFRLGLGALGVPLVIVAGHDRFWNTSVRDVQGRFGTKLLATFIDNWRDEFESLPATHPINWSANFDHYWHRPELAPEKEYDIFFLGYNSHPDRARFIDLIEREYGHLNNSIYLERRSDTTDSYVTKAEYFSQMLRSKVCLNLRGAAQGGKTLRFLEIPYVGSLMVTQTFSDVQLHPFVHGEHCLYFNDDRTLRYALDVMLGDDRLRERIARNGHEHLLAHHTVDSRIRYVLDRIGVKHGPQ
jgi:hypothetical protein